VIQSLSQNALARWWWILLLLPLGLFIYSFTVGTDSVGPDDDVITTSRNTAPPVLEADQAQPLSTQPTHQKNIVLEAPEKKTLPEDTPAALNPEQARVAVHAVENTVYTRAGKMFEQEPVDPQWAPDYENSLYRMFSQHYGLRRVSINSILCHTTMCRIEAFTPRDSDADFFTAMFYEALNSFEQGSLKAEAAIARNMENGVTSVYVARKDHALGFY
jgi:hypothetical protein